MKKYLSAISLSLALLLGFAGVAYADDGLDHDDVDTEVEDKTRRDGILPRLLDKRDQVRAEVAEKQEAFQEELEARRTNAQTSLEDRRSKRAEEIESKKSELEARKVERTDRRIQLQQDVAERKVDHVYKLMLATVERLEGIADRITSRIEELQARGADTGEAEEFVRLARVDLEEARILAEALVQLDLSGEKAQDNFERIRMAAREVKEHLRSAQENLRKALRSLGSVTRPDGDEDESGTDGSQ